MESSLPKEGSLSEIGFCEVLAALCRDRETGVLRLSGTGPEKSVYLQGGSIIFAASKDPDDRLGELLLTREVINRQQLEEAARHVVPGKRLGTVLVEMGFLPAAELPRWVREQVKEILFSLFSWPEGSYRFESGPLTAGEAITLRLPTTEVFLSGLSRVQKWSVLRKGAGETRIPYRLALEHGEALRGASLGVEEKKLLALLQSKTVTMEQAALESGLSTLRVYQLFFAFRVLGVVVEEERPRPVPNVQDTETPLENQAATVRFIAPNPAPPRPGPTGERKLAEAAPAAPPLVGGGPLGAATVLLRMPAPERAARKETPETPASAAGEVAPEVAPMIPDGATEENPANIGLLKDPGVNPSTPIPRTMPAARKAAPVNGSAPTRGSSSIAPSSPKRGKPEFRVVRVEGEKLGGQGAPQIEDLLRQWCSKGYYLGGVVPGSRVGLFGSAGSCFFIFLRDSSS